MVVAGGFGLLEAIDNREVIDSVLWEYANAV
jgi:hypothetical protein